MLNDCPPEILLEIFHHLDDHKDVGLFAISTCNRRLHYLALPLYLAAYDVPPAPELSSKGLVLRSDQLEVLSALQTSLFIRSLTRISCSFSLNSARHGYTAQDRDRLFRYIRTLASLLSRLEWVNEVTLDFRELNFWVMEESLDVLETWGSVITALLDAVLASRCKRLNVEDGMFIVHPSQFPRWRAAMENGRPRSTVMSDITRRLWSTLSFTKQSIQRAVNTDGTHLRAFNLHSRILLLHPCYSWTLAALGAATPNLTSLSIARVDIPESSWDDVFPSIHIPALEDLTLNLKCRIKPLAFIQFLLRHPLIHTLIMGRELFPLADGVVAPRDCLLRLTSLSASPPFIRFLMAERRSASIFSMRVLVKVSSNAPYDVGRINRDLATCHSLLAQEHIRMTLAILVDYASSHWTGFFPEEDGSSTSQMKVFGLNRPPSSSLQHAQTLEFESKSPSEIFEALALRWLPSLPRLRSASFTNCLRKDADADSFVHRVGQACPTIKTIVVDGTVHETL